MKNLYKEYDAGEKEFFDSFTSNIVINGINPLNGLSNLTNLSNEREKLCEAKIF